LNTETYISSGILELYVLGTLTDQEILEVVGMLAQYPAIKEEKEVIESTLEAFSIKNTVAPPSPLKGKIMNSLTGSEQKTPVTDMANTWKYLTAASVSLAILAGSLAFYYRTMWQSTEAALNLALVEQSSIADHLKFTQQKLMTTENSLAIVNDPAFRRIILSGINATPTYLASVYWNEQTAETYLNVGNLNTLKSNQQYQLWGIVDGQPVDAGLVDVMNGQLVLKMKNTGSPAAFAITIEPAGGSIFPTLDRMVVLGNV